MCFDVARSLGSALKGGVRGRSSLRYGGVFVCSCRAGEIHELDRAMRFTGEEGVRRMVMMMGGGGGESKGRRCMFLGASPGEGARLNCSCSKPPE